MRRCLRNRKSTFRGLMHKYTIMMYTLVHLKKYFYTLFALRISTLMKVVFKSWKVEINVSILFNYSFYYLFFSVEQGKRPAPMPENVMQVTSLFPQFQCHESQLETPEDSEPCWTRIFAESRWFMQQVWNNK